MIYKMRLNYESRRRPGSESWENWGKMGKNWGKTLEKSLGKMGKKWKNPHSRIQQHNFEQHPAKVATGRI